MLGVFSTGQVKVDNEKFVEVNTTKEKTSEGSEWAEQFAQEKYKLNSTLTELFTFRLHSFSFTLIQQFLGIGTMNTKNFRNNGTLGLKNG
jgi:hypothetical protein